MDVERCTFFDGQFTRGICCSTLFGVCPATDSLWYQCNVQNILNRPATCSWCQQRLVRSLQVAICLEKTLSATLYTNMKPADLQLLYWPQWSLKECHIAHYIPLQAIT